MQMNDLPFNPREVHSHLNPPHPEWQLPLNTGECVGKVVWLDPRRIQSQPRLPGISRGRRGPHLDNIRKFGQRQPVPVHPIVDDKDYDALLVEDTGVVRACCKGQLMVLARVLEPLADVDLLTALLLRLELEMGKLETVFRDCRAHPCLMQLLKNQSDPYRIFMARRLHSFSVELHWMAVRIDHIKLDPRKVHPAIQRFLRERGVTWEEQ